MNIMVIGLGSMGRRRIRLIKHIDNRLNIIGVDTSLERCEQARGEFNIECTNSIAVATSEMYCESAFVCTSPISHSAIIIECLNLKLNVFTEINLIADNYTEIINLAARQKCKLFLSSTMMYRKEIHEIKKHVSLEISKLRYNYHVGQYLPDWHPWENYKDFFVGNKRTNGCREIFAIEFPWIIDMFGKVKEFTVHKDKVSDLEIDYPDTYLLLIEHESGAKGTLAVDIISRKPVRLLEVYSQNIHLFWNGTPNGLSVFDVDTKKLETIDVYDDIIDNPSYADNIIENAYILEIETFLEVLNGNNENELYTIQDDMYTLDLIDKIEL